MSLRRLLLALAVLGAALAAQTKPFRIQDVVAIRYPSAWRWSPDGQSVSFDWDIGGVHQRYSVSAEHPATPQLLTGAGPGVAAPRHPLEARPGRGPGESQPGSRALPPAARERTAAVLSPDGVRSARVDGNAIVITTLASGASISVPLQAQPRALRWSPDGRRLAYMLGGGPQPHNFSAPEVGDKIIFRVTGYEPGQLYVVAASGGAPGKVPMPAGGYGAAWLNADTLLASAVAPDSKSRAIYFLDARGGAPRAVYTDHEPKFFSMFGRDARPKISPNRQWIEFGSDASGWDQIYVMPASGGPAVQVTRGAFASWRAAWSHDSTRIAFDANAPGHPGDRQIGVVALHGDPAHATITWLTHGRGTNIGPMWSPHDRRLAYQHTDAQHSADLYVIPSAGGTPLRLTDSMPPPLRGRHFVAPELIHYRAADGKSVPAWLFLPPHFDKSKRHAAIVWIHPDGVNQNYDGWHTDRNEAVYYSFHQYLLQEGYVVIAPDYRGSIGYGRAWRTAVYRDVGGEDATDARLAANYLKSLPYVDPQRIGVWGLSYGGYFTLRAITTDPTLFACAVDVAGLVNPAWYYKDPYHSGWMAERMGTPEQNPEGYARGATSTHMDRLARPLLILAGTADVNVPFWETTLLLDSILKDGKGSLVQFMMYPGEFHYFDRAFVLHDAWRRVDDFFHAHLHPQN